MTGGMGGLGEAIARALHDAGHKVLVTHARDEGSAREWLSAEKAKGYSFVSYDVNVADFKSCLRMAERISLSSASADSCVGLRPRPVRRASCLCGSRSPPSGSRFSPLP